MGCSASRHGASVVAKMRAVDAADLLELMADCARNPVFPSAEVEKLRGQSEKGQGTGRSGDYSATSVHPASLEALTMPMIS